MGLLGEKACERLHRSWFLFPNAYADLYAGTPAGGLGFACFFVLPEEAGSAARCQPWRSSRRAETTGCVPPHRGNPAQGPAAAPTAPSRGEKQRCRSRRYHVDFGPQLGLLRRVGIKGTGEQPLDRVYPFSGQRKCHFTPGRGVHTFPQTPSLTLCSSTVNTEAPIYGGKLCADSPVQWVL